MTSLDDLRQIDPAGPPDLHAHEHPRAERLAQETMAHPVPLLPASRRGLRRGLLLAGAAAAVVVGGLVFVPALGGGDAYSAWTAMPTPASAEDRAAAADTCQERIFDRRPASGTGSGASTGEGEATAEVAIAEQRGEFTYVVLHSAAVRADCLFDGNPDDPGAWSGTVLSVDGYTEPEPDGISAAALTVSGHRGEYLVFLSARSGHLVEAVELHVPGAPGPVHASVENGMLAAWVPAWTMEPGDITLRLQLSDGTTVDLDQEQIHGAGRVD